ncbi:rRNA maturation RNase YbeY [Gaoshiqia sediminis]|uniref:Endoribonuclease YbeY n=1 Tax=Gaoshiqia sediminis TaxID=2986998 RepID=A0AA41Y402_9BACT|nr:rRNA maturation RNase YbeY [Gaoshiqia sediminis]MCW0481464.1 rRNA maturation RNase YbeY [Gaoshiqia sediminis]
MSINFYYEDVADLHLDKKRLKNWITSTIKEEGKLPAELSFIFCSDPYLLEINKQYLDHDYFTDIITFDYVEGNLVSGDIFISLDRVSENADTFRVSFSEELNRILIHGVLHLCGYADKLPQEKEIMTQKEDFYLDKL